MASTIVKQSTSIQLTADDESEHKMKKEFVASYGQSASFVLVSGLVFGFQLSWDDKKLQWTTHCLPLPVVAFPLGYQVLGIDKAEDES